MPKKPRKAVKTDREIVDRCNALARIFYQGHGCVVPEGYDFSAAAHPQERGMWNLAVAAFDFIEGTDVLDALGNLEDE